MRAGRSIFPGRRCPIPATAAGRVDDAWVRTHPCSATWAVRLQGGLARAVFAASPRPAGAAREAGAAAGPENGDAIAVGLTDDPTIGVDTLEDAENFARLLGGLGIS